MSPTKDELLKTRFELNLARVATLVELAQAQRAPQPSLTFDREGVQAEILRSVIVFLHATFEVALRSYLPKTGRNVTFSGPGDLDKALKRSGVDPATFKHLYPALVQMAKRRNRITHQADLAEPTDKVSAVWNISDEWQLMLWLMIVPAFYYKMRIALGVASFDETLRCNQHLAAMQMHNEFARRLLDFTQLAPDQLIEALKEIANTCNRTVAILKGETQSRLPDISLHH